MHFTDSHAHLTGVADTQGVEALRALLGGYAEAQAEAARERRAAPLLLDPGTEPEDLPARIALLDPVGRAAFLRVAAGVWPSAENLADPRASLDRLEAAIEAADRAGARIAAIGEGGLDYHHIEGPKEAQRLLFEGQLELASRLGLPMIVHSRDAAADTLAILERSRDSGPAIIHCFGYGPEEARSFLGQGSWISFAGNLTYKGSAALREALTLVPADRLLLETDSPYMNPMPRRGKPASPEDVGRTYALAAELRGIGIDELAETVSRNARSLFG